MTANPCLFRSTLYASRSTPHVRWFSHAFSFTTGDLAYILRVNSYLEDFQKDDFAHRRFSSPRLPIPRVVQRGRFDETQYYCITERCPGRTLNTDESSFGIVIFRARSEEAARAVMNADPAVQAGGMRARLFPYRIALMANRQGSAA